MEKRTKNLDAWLFNILFPLISVVVSWGIHYLETKIGLSTTILLLIIIVVLVPVAIYFTNSIYSYISNNSLQEQKDLEIKEIHGRIASERIMNGVYKEDQLALMERIYFFEEIWVVTPDFQKVEMKGLYADIVLSNLKKGTEYRYFVLDTKINRHRARKFYNYCSENKKLHIHYLTDDFFFLVPKAEISIYEPMRRIAEERKGYMKFPLEGVKEEFRF